MYQRVPSGLRARPPPTFFRIRRTMESEPDKDKPFTDKLHQLAWALRRLGHAEGVADAHARPTVLCASARRGVAARGWVYETRTTQRKCYPRRPWPSSPRRLRPTVGSIAAVIRLGKTVRLSFGLGTLYDGPSNYQGTGRPSGSPATQWRVTVPSLAVGSRLPLSPRCHLPAQFRHCPFAPPLLFLPILRLYNTIIPIA